MSKRRSVGDVIRLDDGDGSGPYFGRFNILGAGRNDDCPQCYMDPTHDQACNEWPNVEVLDRFRKPTGDWVYHVAECNMQDAD